MVIILLGLYIVDSSRSSSLANRCDLSVQGKVLSNLPPEKRAPLATGDDLGSRLRDLPRRLCQASTDIRHCGDNLVDCHCAILLL